MKNSETHNIKRKDFLKGIIAVPFVLSGLPAMGKARALLTNSEKNLGYLFDSTKCIGCRACTSACHQVNDMPPISHDKPVDLSEKSRTTIRLVSKRNEAPVYVKKQCMHCLDPACVSACPVSAMRIDEKTGIVDNDPSTCIGCRYCMVACPFDVIQFSWESAAPNIIKCNMCRETNLKDRGIAACVDVCPSGALIFGNRGKLLAEASKRIKAEPKKYVQKIYGEKDGGGTNVLYIAGKDFESMDFPKNLGDESPAVLTESIQSIYSWFIAPVVAFILLYIPVSKNYKKHSGDDQLDL